MEKAVNYAEENFVKTFVVGVGKYVIEELQKIASDENYVFTVENFDDLKGIIDKLQISISSLEGLLNFLLSTCEVFYKK